MPQKLTVRLATASTRADLMVCSLFDDQAAEDSGLASEVLAQLDRDAGSRSGAPRPGSSGSAQVVPSADRQRAADLVFLGLGKHDSFEAASLNGWAVSVLSAASRQLSARVLVVPPSHAVASGARGLQRCTQALLRAGYSFNDFRHKKSDSLRAIYLATPKRQRASAEDRKAVKTGQAIASGQALCRDLANTPPNVATPAWMTSQARKLARRHGFKITVLAEKELAAKRMGGVLAVSSGSAKPPRLVRLSTGSGSKRARVALVGKGVTFDTGGISIKPAASMEEMKYDKCGACTVLGALEAVGRLGLDLRLDAYLPLVENMPDAAAYRPGDIVRCYNGKTVEIINTDAEGRMILADAMAWAAESEPDHLIELSTLTGACVVALGLTGAGLYTPSDDLAASLLDAASVSGERLWRMPMWPEFAELMKGDHSDLKNAGGRWGGANTAAAFLGHFVGDLGEWAHLDIAGPAYSSKPVSQGQAGATGYAVELLVRWLSTLA